ncbi:MAG: DUF2958 domain-containing protein [Cyclobacteriaceae bacterium]
MKLFTKDIIEQLTAQYAKGGSLKAQNVICKIFNPYGAGTWYCINMDPEDEDYIWCIASLFEVEVGSVLRSEIERMKVPPFNLPLERDLHFKQINAEQAYQRLLAGEQL